MAIARARELSATSGNDAGLRGRLEQFGLATVLTFLDLERRSGQILVVTRDHVGRVWLRGGSVISARIEGSRRVNRGGDLRAADVGQRALRVHAGGHVVAPSTRCAARRPRCCSSRRPAAPTKRPHPPDRGAQPSAHLAGVEGDHLLRDGVALVLDREVARVEAMHLGPRQVPQVRLAAFAGEEDVVLAPEDDRLRLPLPQELLPLGVERDVGAVVVEQVELDPPRVRALRGSATSMFQLSGLISSGRLCAVQVDLLDGRRGSRNASSCFSVSGVRFFQ